VSLVQQQHQKQLFAGSFSLNYIGLYPRTKDRFIRWFAHFANLHIQCSLISVLPDNCAEGIRILFVMSSLAAVERPRCRCRQCRGRGRRDPNHSADVGSVTLPPASAGVWYCRTSLCHRQAWPPPSAAGAAVACPRRRGRELRRWCRDPTSAAGVSCATLPPVSARARADGCLFAPPCSVLDVNLPCNPKSVFRGNSIAKFAILLQGGARDFKCSV
jgi:hypothetical protein